MISRANFRIADLQFIRTFKPCSAFLVRLGDEHAVIKGEGADTGKSIGPGEYDERHNDPLFVSRMEFIARNNASTPSVKRSIDIMAKLFSYVTGDLGETFTLESEVEQRLMDWLRAQSHQNPEMLRHQGQTQDPRNYVWYIMKAYRGLCNFLLIKRYRAQPVFTPEEQERGRMITDLLQQNPKYYNQLGRIVAIDTFITNGDRFGVDWQGQSGNWAMQNVFVTFDNFCFRFIGVDFFDTQVARTCYLGVSWDWIRHVLEGNADNRYLLRCFEALRNKGSREQFANWLIEGLQAETYLQIGDEGRRAFREGVGEGYGLLREFYRKGIDKERWPAGLESRFKALG